MTTPLSGVGIVSIAVNIPGPVAAARLAALGADVTKVEPPAGDALGLLDPGWYGRLAARQTVVTIDLKSADGLARMHDLLDEASVLLTSHRPSALARLGLGWPELTGRHPHLSQVAIVGAAGEAAERPGHDLTYQVASGLHGGTGMPRAPLADLVGAERAVAAVLAAVADQALHHRTSYTEVSLEQVAFDLAEPYRLGITTPAGALGGGLPVYGIYATLDGHIALAALEPHFQSRLAEILAVDLTRPALETAFAANDSAHWLTWAEEHDLPLVVVD